MPFYKRENDELLVAPNFVHAPGYSLTTENKDEHTYPVDGWYWFDNLDAALAAFAPQPEIAGVSPRQIRQAMNRVPYGGGTLRDVVEAAVSAGGQDLKDWWLYSTMFERSNPQVSAMAAALDVPETALDDLWALAASL